MAAGCGYVPRPCSASGTLARYSTHQAGAQAEDGAVLALSIDVSLEETVSHVPGVVSSSALRRAQVRHCVRRRDEGRVGAQVQVEALAERLDAVVRAQVRVRAPAPAPVVPLLGERLAEIVQANRRYYFVRGQLLDKTF